jgi:hypothetical protein
MFLQEEAGDLADQLRFCREPVRAADLDRLGREYVRRARAFEGPVPLGAGAGQQEAEARLDGAFATPLVPQVPDPAPVRHVR